MKTRQPDPSSWIRWVFLAIAAAFCALVAFVAFRVIARL
jgi:hypothetical protein